jgi:hypothetical protein
MGKRLNTYVHVPRGDGTSAVFGPADELPDWAVDAIRNPDVWADDGEAESAAADPSTSGSEQEPELEEPPLHGAGSGRDAWAEYAEHLGVEVDEDMSRADIVDAVRNR